jgi:hypothetical protein
VPSLALPTKIELSVAGAFRAPHLDELAVLVELDDPRVDVAVGGKDVAVPADGDVADAIERVGTIARDLLTLPVSRAPVRHPEKTVGIDADPVRPHERPFAPALEDLPTGIDLDDGRLGAMEGVDSPFGVDCHVRYLSPRRAFGHRAPPRHEAVAALRLRCLKCRTCLGCFVSQGGGQEADRRNEHAAAEPWS